MWPAYRPGAAGSPTPVKPVPELQGEADWSVTIEFPKNARWEAIFFLTAVLLFVADQSTKSWIRSYPEGATIFSNIVLQFVRSQNTGAVFGTLQGYSAVLTVFTLIVAIIILLLVLFFWRRLYIFSNPLTRTALGLYFGGAIGNLADRLRFGSVTDFIDFRFWPSFNVADSGMTVGVILFAYALLFMAKPAEN